MTAWTALVPVKPWAHAKTRLDLPAAQREAIARAFTLDLLDVLTATPDVARTVIVTRETELTHLTRDATTLIPEEPGPSGDGLNSAIGTGRDWAVVHHPWDPLVVVPADLPCLTPDDLSATLARLARLPRAYVPDAGGEGTTLAAATTPASLLWAYGPASATRHHRLGLTRSRTYPPESATTSTPSTR